MSGGEPALVGSALAHFGPSEMGASIYIYCPARLDDGPPREVLSEAVEALFEGVAEDCGVGSGAAGFNLDYELQDGEDPHLWADRLKDLLRGLRVALGTRFDVFPDGWEPGDEWRRVEVYGLDLRRTDDP